MIPRKPLKKNTIYIYTNSNGDFVALGKCKYGEFALATDSSRGCLECIKAVNNTLYQFSIYGEKVRKFILREQSFTDFVESIGGIKKYTQSKKVIYNIVVLDDTYDYKKDL